MNRKKFRGYNSFIIHWTIKHFRPEFVIFWTTLLRHNGFFLANFGKNILLQAL